MFSDTESLSHFVTLSCHRVFLGTHKHYNRQFLLTLEARDRPCDKLRTRWYGPFRIVKVINNNAFRADLPHYMRSHPVFNVGALKHYHRNEIVGCQVEPPPPITDADGFERYYVEKILSHRRDRYGLKYLVK